MGLHPEAQMLLDVIAGLGPPLNELAPDAARASQSAARLPSGIEVADVTDIDADGVTCRIYRPVLDITMPCLIWLHGGGWVLGDLEGHDSLCRSLAIAANVVVCSVEYRLAPEHPFPAALEDCMTALRWVSDHATDLGVDAGRLAIGGDSAGGNLAAVVAQHSPIELAGQMLIYPITDARMESQSYRENGEGYLLTTSMMEWFVHHYLAGTSGTPTDPRVSPLRADRAILAETPPAFVLTAEFDPLRDEGEAYADALAAAGVPVESVRYEGQIHAFFSSPELLSDARAAVEDAAAWLRRIVA